jgi:hypothetical protein
MKGESVKGVVSAKCVEPCREKTPTVGQGAGLGWVEVIPRASRKANRDGCRHVVGE